MSSSDFTQKREEEDEEEFELVSNWSYVKDVGNFIKGFVIVAVIVLTFLYVHYNYTLTCSYQDIGFEKVSYWDLKPGVYNCIICVNFLNDWMIKDHYDTCRPWQLYDQLVHHPIFLKSWLGLYSEEEIATYEQEKAEAERRKKILDRNPMLTWLPEDNELWKSADWEGNNET